MGKPNTPGCGSGAGCCVPGECVLGTDDFDRADESPATGWTAAAGGPFAVVGNVLDPPTSASVQLLRWGVGSLFTGALGIQVKLYGDAGDIVGVGIYYGATTYVAVKVKISGTVGRIEYEDVQSGSVVFTHTRDLECIDPDLNIPAGEWLTLTVIWSNWDISGCVIDGSASFNAILETTAGTYLMAAKVPELPTGGDAMLYAENTSANSKYNDALFFNPVEPCDTVTTCCIATTAPYEETGWTEGASGQWDFIPPGLIGYVESDALLATLTLDNTYWNDNLVVSCKIGLDTAVILNDGLTADWRLYFSKAPSSNFYVEMRVADFDPVYLQAQFEYRLFHHNTLLAWMDITGGFDSADEPLPLQAFSLSVTVYDCQIYWGFYYYGYTGWQGGLIVNGGIAGGSEFAVGFVRGVSFCAGDSFDLNHTGKVGIGIGNTSPSEALAFSEFGVACSEDFTCAETPDNDPPDEDPNDPGDPTGCCVGTGWDDLEVGDAVEISISGTTYWFGAGCADVNCDLTSSFLTALNATHSCNVIFKSATALVIYRRLTLTNPCDVCASVDGAPLTIKITVKIFINEDGDCVMTGRVGSNCGGCDMNYLSSAFTAGADCEALTLDYVDPGSPRPEFNCCINGVGSTLTLAVP